MMGENVHFSSKSTKWNTPLELYEALHKEFNFQLDPCPRNPVYDGLLIDWNLTTYVNPPYGREIGKWIEKAYTSSLKGHTIVMLIPSRTDTDWWHKYIMKANEIRFIKGRLYFNVGKGCAPFPSAVVIYRGGERRILPRFVTIDKKGAMLHE